MASKFAQLSIVDIGILECWASNYSPTDTATELKITRHEYASLSAEILRKIPHITSHNRAFFSKHILFENELVVTAPDAPKDRLLKLRVG